VEELIKIQLVSRKYKDIARSCILWKRLYFQRYVAAPSNKYPHYPNSIFEHFLQYRSLPEVPHISDDNIKIMLNKRPNNSILGNNDMLPDLNNGSTVSSPTRSHPSVFYDHPQDVMNRKNFHVDDDDDINEVVGRMKIDNIPYYFQYIFNQLIENEMRCPNCGMGTILPVIYGFPSANILKAAKEQ
jgi:hypothetical protein